MSQSEQLFNEELLLNAKDGSNGREFCGIVTLNLGNYGYGTVHFELSRGTLVFEGTNNGQFTARLKCTNEWTADMELLMRRLKATITLSHLIIYPPLPPKTLTYEGAGEFIAVWVHTGKANCCASFTTRLCLELLPSGPFTDIQNVLSGLSIGRRLFPQIEVAPQDFTTEPGARFVLQSNEGDKFYVHSQIMAEFSPVFKAWVTENRAGLCEGVPLSIRCSTAAVTALLVLLYKQEVVDSFGTVLPEIAEVCDYWRITAVLDVCGQYVRDKETQADFDMLLGWFVSVSVHLVDGELEAILYKQLRFLAVEDEDKKVRIKTQMVEYLKSKKPEESAALLMEIGEPWAKKKKII